MSAATRVPVAGLLASAMLVVVAPALVAQDLYDVTVLRTLSFDFHDEDWLELLEDNYASQTNILADLTVDGDVYPDVGVRIRGNTSYFALPAGSEKFSLNVDIDFTHDGQDLLGYDSLNLNNGFRDPTFCREVVYNNYVAQFIANPRANHVVVTLEGENWGVYNNIQQFDKTMLSDWFDDDDGLRIKCPNDPTGPGLRYFGENPSSYMNAYEIKDDGGLADPWGTLIEVCDAVTNWPVSSWETIDEVFAVDPSIWSVVLENVLTDDDSYVHKGADFMTYRNPLDGRMVLLQTDANETFTETNWSPTLNFGSATKPVLSHVLDAPELRQRYMAHYREVLADLDWATFEPIFAAHRALIDEAVQNDPKKLYSYELFEDNFTETVFMPYGGLAGGNIIGLEEFIEERATYLGGQTELNTAGPTIADVTVSDLTPNPGQSVTVTATVTAAGSPIDTVELFYRETPTTGYERVTMTDGGSGVYAANLPVAGTSGQVVTCYVSATADNVYGSATFSPARTEWDPIVIEYVFGAVGGMRISEWMYSGDSGEFIEFTNMSESPVDMTGWSFDDDHVTPGEFDLSGFGVVAPGESVVLTEAVAEDFRLAWGLDPSVKIVGLLGDTEGNNIGRNDQLNLYDGSGTLVDRLTYGDEDVPGSVRTQDESGQTCCEHFGQDDALAWVLSGVGDDFGSFTATTGEIGTPGSYGSTSCGDCTIVGVPDVAQGVWLAPSRPNPFHASTEIAFRLDREGTVAVTVFDAAGRLVRRLADGRLGAGPHAMTWDGADAAGRQVPPGIYFVHLRSSGISETRKFVRIP